MTHLSKPKISKQKLGQLIDEHYGLLVSQAISFNPRNKDDLEDYIQIGCIGMIKGIQTFDANIGKFSTYICTCIRNEIIDYLRSEKLNKNFVLGSSFYAEYLDHDKIWEMLPDNIDDKEKKVIELKLNGNTRKEIAKKIGKTENQVRYIIQKFLAKIREANE